MPEPFRFAPLGAREHYKTYALKAPPSTHWRRATCAEIDCPAYLNGWVTIVPTASPQAVYIRAGAGRRFEESAPEAGMASFFFPPGQPCFKASEHRTPLEREPLYIVRDGDFRGNPTGRSMRHQRGSDWVEDFGEHQQAIVDRQARG